jgi:hypothetical protein
VITAAVKESRTILINSVLCFLLLFFLDNKKRDENKYEEYDALRKWER